MDAQVRPKNPSGRRHERTKMRAKIKLIHPAVGEVLVFCADLSDGGLFILQGEYVLPDIGAIVQLQVQDVPVEAPILTAKIVRRTNDGVGVMFLDADDQN